MIKNDTWIEKQAAHGMITPFEDRLIRSVENNRIISYGMSSYGYDIRLSGNEFKTFKRIPGTIINPKNFDSHNLESVNLNYCTSGEYFILPAHSYALGVSLEKLKIPSNITVICIGKSTYARCGIIANLTPAEAGWEGYLTIEISNSSSADCRIYANEGIVQLLFLEGEPCQTTYADRQGKYQNQPQKIVLSKV